MKDKELFDYAIASFAFVLPFNGEFTLKFWADKILELYDDTNVQVSAVVSEIQGREGKIIRRYGSSQVISN